jgi:hypothetical protein
MTQQKKQVQTDTRLFTPEAILSYPALFEPRAGPEGVEGGKPKFSATFVFLKEVQKTPAYVAMQKAVTDLALKAFKGDAAKAQAAIKGGQFRLPWRYDAAEKGYPEGSVYFTARANPDRRPGVVGRERDAATGQPVIIMEEEQIVGHPHELYPGCRVIGLVQFFAYDNIGKGIGVSLQGLQKRGEGERLDSRVAAQDAFEADLSETPASLADMGADGAEGVDQFLGG